LIALRAPIDAGLGLTLRHQPAPPARRHLRHRRADRG